jgi:hypothetical protein
LTRCGMLLLFSKFFLASVALRRCTDGEDNDKASCGADKGCGGIGDSKAWEGVVGFGEGSVMAVTTPFGGGIVLLITFVKALARACRLVGRLDFDVLDGVLGLSCEIVNSLTSSTGAATNCKGETRGEGGKGTV